MLDGIVREIVRSEPRGRSTVELRNQIGLGSVQFEREKLVEQMVEPEPPARVVESHEQ